MLDPMLCDPQSEASGFPHGVHRSPSWGAREWDPGPRSRVRPPHAREAVAEGQRVALRLRSGASPKRSRAPLSAAPSARLCDARHAPDGLLISGLSCIQLIWIAPGNCYLEERIPAPSKAIWRVGIKSPIHPLPWRDPKAQVKMRMFSYQKD